MSTPPAAGVTQLLIAWRHGAPDLTRESPRSTPRARISRAAIRLISGAPAPPSATATPAMEVVKKVKTARISSSTAARWFRATSC
jgi:hypothetical protein